MTGVAGLEGRSSFQVVFGVDTHRDENVAVAIDPQGVRLGEFHTPIRVSTGCGCVPLDSVRVLDRPWDRWAVPGVSRAPCPGIPGRKSRLVHLLFFPRGRQTCSGFP